jgi:alginate O-acetyltransferase complex protein AlgI
MLFSSFEFLFFLPVVFVLYWFVFNKSLKLQNFLILLASYFFYGWWSWKFLLLLAGSTLLDYLYGFGVGSENKKKAKVFLWLSIINNLGILAVFKYYNFFALQFQQAVDLVGMHINPTLINVALPVGISFYTFHGMSYVFDIYRGLRKPVRNFEDYAMFVAFFPLLVAGPIERANHLLPQIQAKRAFSFTQAMQGCRLILWGMFKKVIIADNLAVVVDMIFNDYKHYNAAALVMGAVAFSFQIYGDFSGYSDIALGTAKLFGFELLSNFKYPYLSRDIAEFWRRWHISLSSWFRDYLYIPLGGSKDGKYLAVRNTFIIFLVSGFWHGASWNFIVWGAIHACGFLPLLLLNRNRHHTGNIVAYNKLLPDFKELIQILGTFSFVTLAWIFFRAHTLKTAVDYLYRILIGAFTSPAQFLQIPDNGIEVTIYILFIIAGDWWLRRDERVLKPPPRAIAWLVYLILGVAIFLSLGKKQTFIYFQF